MPPTRHQPSRACNRTTNTPARGNSHARPQRGSLGSASVVTVATQRLRASNSAAAEARRAQVAARVAAHRNAHVARSESNQGEVASHSNITIVSERRREQQRQANQRYRARQIQIRTQTSASAQNVSNAEGGNSNPRDASRRADGTLELANVGTLPLHAEPVGQLPDDVGWWTRQEYIIRRLTSRPNSLECHWQPACLHCGTCLLDFEDVNFCCKLGTKLAPLAPLTPALSRLALQPGIPHASLHLNQTFQFAVQWYSGRRIPFGPGPPAVAVQGTISRRVLPVDRNASPLNTYLYQPQSFEANSVAGISAEWMQTIRAEIHQYNELLHQFREFQRDENASVLELRTEGPAREIASVLHYGAGALRNPRTFCVFRASDATPSKLHYNSELYEPLSYPILFPQGHPGWPLTEKWTQREYYRFLLLSERRFRDFAMLGSLYVIDMMCRIEDQRLDFITRGLARARSSMGTASLHEVDEHEPSSAMDDVESPSFDARLPSSFVGSRAYRAEHVADALALARRFGKPHGMLTLTTNPDWPELRAMLRPGQTATNVPMITVRVFRARLSKCMKLFKVHFGPVLYTIKVIEFQRRGLPHAHIVFCLKTPCPIDCLDQIVCGEVPPESQPRLRELVLRFMRHPDDHIVRANGTPNTSSRCNKDGQCVWKFPQPLAEETAVDPVSERVIYRRRHEEDRMIAQYPPLILLAWEGHAHIDFSVSLESFVYIFKYIHKGPDYVDFRFANGAESFEEAAERAADEYVRARYLSATEATWRIFGFDLTSKSPSVARLGVHTPGSGIRQYSVSNTPGSEASSLTRYFLRPSVYSHMTYVQYNENVVFRATTAEERSNPRLLSAGEQLENVETGQRYHPRAVKLRERGMKVSRMRTVRPGAGEVYYLRQLLLHRPASSWDELKTVTGPEGSAIRYRTFQEAAVAYGIFDETSEAALVLQEAISVFTPARELRFLFCLLITDGTPALPLWNQFQQQLSRDHLPLAVEATDQNRAEASEQAKQELAQILADMGSSLREQGLGTTVSLSIEAEVDREFFAARELELRLAAAASRTRFTQVQMETYNALMNSVFDSRAPKLHLIQGRAGRGKTFVVAAAINELRASGKVLAVTGATGLSASAFLRGTTVHRMFSIPVVDDLDTNPVVSRLEPDSRRWKFLQDSVCIVIDEIWALHRAIIEAVDQVLRQIGEPHLPFGGKPVFAIGDPRQTAPIVRNGGKPQILESSFLATAVFNSFILHELTDSMRNGEDSDFSDWVDAVGDDVSGNDTVITDFMQATTSQADARYFLFPPAVLTDSKTAALRAFLSPYNAAVAEFNHAVLEDLPGDLTTIRSYDSVKGDVESHEDAHLAQPEMLNTLEQPGTPTHELRLKRGALCVVMRNMSAEDGLVKNARVEVLRCGTRSVKVRVLASGNEFTLPRITFEFQPGYFPFRIIRKQIPLRLAYAVTFHGCQGATLDRTVIDCRLPVFTHGQRYASVSRCRHRSHSIVLLSDNVAAHLSAVASGGSVAVNNIVYEELVRAAPILAAPQAEEPAVAQEAIAQEAVAQERVAQEPGGYGSVAEEVGAQTPASETGSRGL